MASNFFSMIRVSPKQKTGLVILALDEEVPILNLAEGGIQLMTLQHFSAKSLSLSHHENMPIQIYRKFHLHKLKIFR